MREATTSQHLTKHFGRRRRVVVAVSGFLLVTSGFVLHAQVGGAIPTTGNTYYVNSATDTGATDCPTPSNTDCGIDDAITAFNADSTANDADKIVFDSSIATFTVGTPTAIANTTSGVTLAIEGNGVGTTAVSGGSNEAFTFDSGVTASISGLTIENGDVFANGGAISNSGNLTVTNDDFSSNQAFGGDAGAIESGSSLTVTNSTFYDNGSAGNGGAIETVSSGIVDLTITGSTFYDNGTGEGSGGAISYASGVGGNLNITNSTFYDNDALHDGGAVVTGLFDTGGDVTVTDSTFSANHAGTGGGGAISIETGSATLSNTVLSNNVEAFNSAGNCGGTITDGGYNISYPASDTSCPTTFGSGNPNLGPLQGNGGPTQTMAIGPGSSAYELVPAASCTVDIDQRGDARPGVSGANCDAGAYEYQQPSITSTPEPGSEVVGGAALQDSATLGNIGNLAGTGAITFNLYGPGDSSCTTSLYTTTVSSITTGGTYDSTSGNNTAGYEAEAPGTYNWTVSYGGDANNASVSTACGSEQVTVSPVSPTGFTTAITAPSQTAVGDSWNDAATVTGNTTYGAPTGSVAFTLCSVGSPATSCTGGAAVGTVSSPTTSGDASTFTLPAGDAQSPSSPGTYCYNASYSPAVGSDYSSVSAQSDTECFTIGTATITAVDGLATKAGTDTTTVAVSPQHVGDLMTLAVKVCSPTVMVSSVSGGGVTSWTKAVGPYAAYKDTDLEIFTGVVSASGSSTITVTFSASVRSVYTGLAAREFSGSAGTSTTWAIDTGAGIANTSSSTVTFPKLTPASMGELYFGYGAAANTGSAGTTPGFTYATTVDADVVTYDTGVMGTVQPSAKQSPAGVSGAVAVLVRATGPVPAPTPPTAIAAGSLDTKAGTDTTTLSVSPQHTGDLMALAVKVASSTITPSSVTGGGVSTWKRVQGPYTAYSGMGLEIWSGVVSASGPSTISVTFSASVHSIYVGLAAQEFSASTGASTVWGTDTGAGTTNASSSTVTFPKLTPTGAGEIYFGYGAVKNTAAAGTTTGFTYAKTVDADVVAYDTDVSGAVQPTAKQIPAGVSGGLAVLITFT